MILELPERLEAALKVQANALGVSPAGHVREILQRDLAKSIQSKPCAAPLKAGWGMFAKYGQSPSAEEIEANRADMFKGFDEGLD